MTATINMTAIQKKNAEKMIDWLDTLTDEEFDKVNNLWGDYRWWDKKEAGEELKAICKANGVAFKWLDAWMFDEI